MTTHKDLAGRHLDVLSVRPSYVCDDLASNLESRVLDGGMDGNDGPSRLLTEGEGEIDGVETAAKVGIDEIDACVRHLRSRSQQGKEGQLGGREKGEDPMSAS